MRKFASALCVLTVLTGCSAQRKISYLKENPTPAELSPTFRSDVPDIEIKKRQRDTLKVEAPDGREVLIMKAIRDEDGEMVATDVLDAAVVTAKFRNVAERNGLVEISFDVTVPQMMQDSKWQLRLYPRMEVMGDTLDLDPVIITGRDYRRSQLKGYEQYQRFLESIITDPSLFVNQKDLERFLLRNIPEIYAFKSDSSYVSDEQFSSSWGVTQKEAVDHYTRGLMVRRNNSREARQQKMYNKYVKVPIVTEGIRLDTVMVSDHGDFVYEYVQSIEARPALRKVEVCLTGEIFEQQNRIWTLPMSEPLTFYISSLSTLTDNREKYLTKVIERRAEANSAYMLEFRTGQSELTPELGGNRFEIDRIKSSLLSLLENRDFDLDSIVVSASCSPEGRFSFNQRLSQRRSQDVCRYFQSYISQCMDSLRRDRGVLISLDEEFAPEDPVSDIGFIARSAPEDWDTLKTLIERDTTLTGVQKSSALETLGIADPDSREAALSRTDGFQHIRDNLYPRLRTVRFAFHLHRKGMVKDTVHTTVLDSVYMEGVQAIRDRDYKKAATLLRPYEDFNTAVAFCSLEYNASAMEILRRLDPDDKTEYMLAILYSRSGDDQAAVQHFINSCSLNPSFIHRGNLDPEISSLIRRYNLSLEEEYPEDDLL